MRQRISIAEGIPYEGAMDFSCLLDAPAGKHGFVQVKQGHLFFEDGGRARFFGINFPARAAMPDHGTAERMSFKLATMGMNVVRLHAADVMTGPGGWTANPDSPLLDYASGCSRNFHPEGLDRLDYFFYRLKEKGIYIHLDLFVARVFTEGDELDYPDAIPAHTKCLSHFNQRMIDLQKEYAQKLLTHVNPYTGIAYKDDPAVMTIELANEDSAFFDNNRIRHYPGWSSYFDEMQERFNHFLLMKYNNRSNLERAWTFEGKCALRQEEAPEEGSVRLLSPGEYFQPVNDPMGDWLALESPARYADYAEFCVMLNQKYHREMIDFIRGLGCGIPIATENLLRGLADVYSCICGDVMENNAYFNHPTVGYSPDYTFIPNMAENVSNDPRTHSYPDMCHRTNIISQVSQAFVEGKPFVMTEWNEYGACPFHSTAFPMTTAYACLQDWDGLILYTYHTSDRDDDQPGDVIEDIMDFYNDPSLVCQIGALSGIFLKGMIRKARQKVQYVFTPNELKTQPRAHRLVHSMIPYISRLKTEFLACDIYQGEEEVAVSGGFLSNGDYRSAKHAVIFAQSPYRDAQRKSYAGAAWLAPYKENSRCLREGVWLNERFLVFDEIASISLDNDYRIFAQVIDTAFKLWGIWEKETGISSEDGMVSDTGEINFCPGKSRFSVASPFVSVYSGRPEGDIHLGSGLKVICKNDRITLVRYPLDGKACADSRHFLVYAMGRSGMDETRYEWDENRKDCRMYLNGKLYLETLEGEMLLACPTKPSVWALDVYGKRIQKLEGQPRGDGIWQYRLSGALPSANYEVYLTSREDSSDNLGT